MFSRSGPSDLGASEVRAWRAGIADIALGENVLGRHLLVGLPFKRVVKLEFGSLGKALGKDLEDILL